MVIPRSFSSFALSIWSNALAVFASGYLSGSTLVIAAVRGVFPWSMCPMVPMLTCGLVRWNLAFATGVSSLRSVPTVVGVWRSRGAPAADGLLLLLGCTDYDWCCLLASCLGDDFLGDARRDLGIRVELHAVVRPALGPAAQVADAAEHLRQGHEGGDHPYPRPLFHRLHLAPATVQVADDL